MKTTVVQWIGLGLGLLAAFCLSLFYMAWAGFSKISLSRFLEDEDKRDRGQVLERYDDIRIAIEFWRTILVIAVLVYFIAALPRLSLWPLWFFLGAALTYGIFLDILPRFFVSRNKEGVLNFFLPSFRLFLILSAPVLAVSRRLCEREESEEEEEEDREASRGEIETFIDSAREEGIIEKDEGVLLRSVVEFGDTVVREIMTPRVDIVGIRKEATIQKLRSLIITEKYSRIPVYKDRLDNIEGVVMAKDLLQFSDDRHGDESIEAFIRPVIFVPESMKVAELLKEFQRKKQKLAMVVDEHGGISGLVTMEDLVEEIVGEIHDEYDTEEAKITEIGPQEYLVSGDVNVGELEKLFDLELAEDNYLSASGMITHHLGRLPKKGEAVDLKGLAVEVIDVDQKRIKKLKLRKLLNKDQE